MAKYIRTDGYWQETDLPKADTVEYVIDISSGAVQILYNDQSDALWIEQSARIDKSVAIWISDIPKLVVALVEVMRYKEKQKETQK